MHQIRYTYLFSPFVFSFSKVLSFDDLTIAPPIGNVNKNFMLKLCNVHKNRSVYKQDNKWGKITVVKMHNIVAHKLCINTIIDTKTGKAVKKKTRNSYILHKNLFFEIIAKKGALNL